MLGYRPARSFKPDTPYGSAPRGSGVVIICFTATISRSAPLVSRRVQEHCSIHQASLPLTILAEVMLSLDAVGEE